MARTGGGSRESRDGSRNAGLPVVQPSDAAARRRKFYWTFCFSLRPYCLWGRTASYCIVLMKWWNLKRCHVCVGKGGGSVITIKSWNFNKVKMKWTVLYAYYEVTPLRVHWRCYDELCVIVDPPIWICGVLEAVRGLLINCKTLRISGMPKKKKQDKHNRTNPLNPELNPICYLLALLAHNFLHVSRIRVKSLTLRLLMSYIYIYGAPILDVSRSYTTTHHSR